MSGGVVYAGGGTALQKALKITDSVEQMYRFIALAGTVHPPLDKIQLYCEGSVEHFDWLVAQGIPYTEKFSLSKELPMGDESLYFSGNELAWPTRDLAARAPRGHVPGVVGMNGGRRLMQALLQQAAALGVEMRASVRAERLVVERDGRIAGMIVISGILNGNLSSGSMTGNILALISSLFYAGYFYIYVPPCSLIRIYINYDIAFKFSSVVYLRRIAINHSNCINRCFCDIGIR